MPSSPSGGRWVKGREGGKEERKEGGSEAEEGDEREGGNMQKGKKTMKVSKRERKREKVK